MEVIQSGHRCTGVRMRTPGLATSASPVHFTRDYVGGGHLQIYVRNMRTDAAKNLEPSEREALHGILDAKLLSTVPTESPTPRRFVRNWSIDDITPHLDRVGQGRSFENGQAMFTVANCVQCHRFNNIGGILGPDITGAAKRYTRAVMVREILAPSFEISDQFRTHVIVTTAGRVHEGRILNRTSEGLTVAINPLSPASVIQIPNDEVDELVPSKVSMMPKDLLNTLTIDDILDLLAFIESGGDKEHAIFTR